MLVLHATLFACLDVVFGPKSTIFLLLCNKRFLELCLLSKHSVGGYASSQNVSLLVERS